MANNAPAIGIDLGTTYSCVAVFQYGTVEVIADDENNGNRTTPSVVAFSENNHRLIGGPAKYQLTMAKNSQEEAEMIARNTVFDVKRLIGRPFNDDTILQDKKNYPFEIVNLNGKPYIKVSVCVCIFFQYLLILSFTLFRLNTTMN